eukprot:14419503-Heterocapsa_arctica.AAC.1
MHSCIPTQFIYTLMIACNMEDQEDCLGYILYEDLGNKPYAAALGNASRTRMRSGYERTRRATSSSAYWHWATSTKRA